MAEHHEATRPDFNSLIIGTSTRGRSRGMTSVLTLSTMSLSAFSPRPRLGIPRNTIPSKLHDPFQSMPHNAPQKRIPPGITARFHAISPLGTNDCRRHRCEPRHYGCWTAHIHGPGNQPGPAIPRRLVITAARNFQHDGNEMGFCKVIGPAAMGTYEYLQWGPWQG